MLPLTYCPKQSIVLFTYCSYCTGKSRNPALPYNDRSYFHCTANIFSILLTKNIRFCITFVSVSSRSLANTQTTSCINSNTQQTLFERPFYISASQTKFTAPMEPRRPTPEPIPENLLHSLSALGTRIDGIQNTFLLSANSLQNALFHAKLSRTMIAEKIRTKIHQLRVEAVFVRERAERERILGQLEWEESRLIMLEDCLKEIEKVEEVEKRVYMMLQQGPKGMNRVRELEDGSG
ncbi:hypothetical protein V2W45_220078 [Cenococcum geophilum]